MATSAPRSKPSSCLGVVGGQFGDFVGVFIQRMAGDVDAEHLFFAGEFLLRRPIGQRGQGMLDMRRLRSAIMPNSPACPLCAIFPRALAGLHGILDHRRQLRAIAAQAGERPALIKFSSTRRFTLVRSTRSQKS